MRLLSPPWRLPGRHRSVAAKGLRVGTVATVRRGSRVNPALPDRPDHKDPRGHRAPPGLPGRLLVLQTAAGRLLARNANRLLCPEPMFS